MGWNYKNEEEANEHLRMLNKQMEDEVVKEIADAFMDELDEDEEDEEQEYETYVKYICVYRSSTVDRAFETLEAEVNKFIESQSDSFILEGPVQMQEHWIVQTLINEDEM